MNLVIASGFYSSLGIVNHFISGLSQSDYTANFHHHRKNLEFNFRTKPDFELCDRMCYRHTIQYDIYLGLVHTMPDKFEKATLRAKTEQMFCVHPRAF